MTRRQLIQRVVGTFAVVPTAGAQIVKALRFHPEIIPLPVCNPLGEIADSKLAATALAIIAVKNGSVFIIRQCEENICDVILEMEHEPPFLPNWPTNPNMGCPDVMYGLFWNSTREFVRWVDLPMRKRR